MRLTIQLGGDTDTNACILGGMLGAALGVKSIPSSMLQKVLSFNCENPQPNGHKRPSFLNTSKHLVENMEKLLKVRAKNHLVID